MLPHTGCSKMDEDVKSRFLSHYHEGRAYADGREWAKAAVAYTQAERLVDNVENDSLAGLLYLHLGHAYMVCGDYPNGLKAYQSARAYSRKAADFTHLLEAELGESQAYDAMGKKAESYHVLLKASTSAAFLRKEQFQESTLSNLFMQCVEMEKWELANHFRAELMGTQETEDMPSPLLVRLAVFYAQQGEEDTSQHYLEKAWAKATSRKDTAELYGGMAKLQEWAQSYQSAYDNLQRAVHLQNSLVRETYQHPMAIAQRDYLNKELELQAYTLRMERTLRMTILVAGLLLAGVAVYVFRNHVKRLHHRYGQLQSDIIVLQNSLAETRKLSDDQQTEMEAMRRLIAERTKELNGMTGRMKLLFGPRSARLHLDNVKAIQVALSLLEDHTCHLPDDRVALRRWMDLSKNNFASRLSALRPPLKEHYIDICCLMALGLSVDEVAAVMRVTPQTVERYMTQICVECHYPSRGKKGFMAFLVDMQTAKG